MALSDRQFERICQQAGLIAVTALTAMGCSVQKRDIAREEPILGSRTRVVDPYATSAVAVSATPAASPQPMPAGQPSAVFAGPTATVSTPQVQLAQGPGYPGYGTYPGQVMVAPAQPMMVSPPPQGIPQQGIPIGVPNGMAAGSVPVNMPPPFSGPTTGSTFVPAPGTNFPTNHQVPAAPGGQAMVPGVGTPDGLRNQPNLGQGGMNAAGTGEILPASGFLSNSGFGGLRLHPQASAIPVFNNGAAAPTVPSTLKSTPPASSVPSRPMLPNEPPKEASKGPQALELPPPPAAPKEEPKASETSPPPPPSFEEMPLFQAPPAFK